MSDARPIAAPLPTGLAAPVGPYSHAVIANGQVFVSGLLALDETGTLVGEGDAGAQARFIFDTLERILRAAGSDLDRVVKLNFYLLRLEDRGVLNEVRHTTFGAWKPASTLVQVFGLIGEGTLLEVEATATLDPLVVKQEQQ